MKNIFVSIFKRIFIYALAVLVFYNIFIFFTSDELKYIPWKIPDFLSWLSKHIALEKFLDSIWHPTKFVADFIIATAGFLITVLGFYFVVEQISTLGNQISIQKEQHHKDSEFKNFLDAAKLLTSAERYNFQAHAAAMYLLHDFAKKYPDNLEKVIKILNKYTTPIFINDEVLVYNSGNARGHHQNCRVISDRRTINEWHEANNAQTAPEKQTAVIALDLIKRLFIHALDSERSINLSNVVIFDLDIEKDISANKIYKLFNLLKNSERMIFLCCNFSSQRQPLLPALKNKNIRKYISTRKSIKFATPMYKADSMSIRGRLDLSLARFISCDISNCDFSYSNLWCVSFEDCTMNDVIFKQAECEGVLLKPRESNGIKLDEMLFLGKMDLPVKFGVIYKDHPDCFQCVDDYVKFKNSKGRINQ